MEEPNLQNVPKPRAFNVEATQTQRATEAAATPTRREHDANIRCALPEAQCSLLCRPLHALVQVRVLLMLLPLPFELVNVRHTLPGTTMALHVWQYR